MRTLLIVIVVLAMVSAASASSPIPERATQEPRPGRDLIAVWSQGFEQETCMAWSSEHTEHTRSTPAKALTISTPTAVTR